MLFVIWNESFHRPTQDIDFAARGSFEADDVVAALQDVCRVAVDAGVVGELVMLFLTPPRRALTRGDRFATAWPPGGPWRPEARARSGGDV